MAESYKITAVGDGYVGKTCMLIRYTQNLRPIDYEPTVFETYTGTITVDDKEYDIQLWDTAGQEDYDRLRPLSYKITHCFLICFSVDSPKSFNNVLDKWAPEIKCFKSKTPIILVGTKIDLRNDSTSHCLKKENGFKLKNIIKAKQYVECSSVTGEGIENVFQEAIRAILIYNNKRNRRCSIL